MIEVIQKETPSVKQNFPASGCNQVTPINSGYHRKENSLKALESERTEEETGGSCHLEEGNAVLLKKL